MNDLLTSEDTLVLDQMLAHEAKCEMLHEDPRNQACTVTVAFKAGIGCANRRRLVCEAGGLFYDAAMADRKNFCQHCGNECADCWTLVPA